MLLLEERGWWDDAGATVVAMETELLNWGMIVIDLPGLETPPTVWRGEEDDAGITGLVEVGVDTTGVEVIG